MAGGPGSFLWLLPRSLLAVTAGWLLIWLLRLPGRPRSTLPAAMAPVGNFVTTTIATLRAVLAPWAEASDRAAAARPPPTRSTHVGTGIFWGLAASIDAVSRFSVHGGGDVVMSSAFVKILGLLFGIGIALVIGLSAGIVAGLLSSSLPRRRNHVHGLMLLACAFIYFIPLMVEFSRAH